MQIFSRLFDFYKDVNPSTLTGAVDVVVVEDVATGRLSSSPFHVRFGKLQVLRPSEKKVEIEVNGKAVEGVSMKIGMAGETFFVLPVEGPVPSEYQTSPLPEPIKVPPGELPAITLSPVPIEPLSDSEIDAGTSSEPRYKPDRSALSDSELDTVGSGPIDKEEWSWKWGDLPTKDTKEMNMEQAEQEVLIPEVVVNEPEEPQASAIAATEADILGLAPPIPPRPDVLETIGESAVILSEYIYKRDTVEFMYNRLVEIVEEGVDEVELCLLQAERSLQIRPRDLGSLKSVSSALLTVSWEAFQGDPETALQASYICVFGRSTKCSLFPTKGALQMLVGLRLYKQLIPLERLLRLMGLEEMNTSGGGPATTSHEASAGILSWRQWWSSPRSQSAKAVPAPPSPVKGVVQATAAPSPTKSVASSVVRSPSKQPNGLTGTTDSVSELLSSSPQKAQPDASTLVPPAAPQVNYAKSLRLPSADLQKLNLHYGMNTITFSVSTSKNGRAICAAHIFLWRSDDKIVISDIDGTITKSDALGHLFQMVGKDWTHLGVANLYSDISRNGYRLLYLTSRPIGQATQTRGYLRGIAQNSYQLPEGPVFLSPDRFFTAVRREVIMGNPEEFKIPCLLDIRRLFYSQPLSRYDPMGLTEEECNMPSPFYAGFGNRPTDAVSYQAVGINPSRIYIINPAGDLSLHTVSGYRSSYIKLVDLVDSVFPPLNAAIERDEKSRGSPDATANVTVPKEENEEEEEYNDFFFWRQPISKPDPAQLSLLDSHSELPSASHTLLPAASFSGDGQLIPLDSSSPSADTQHLDDESGSERGDHYYFDEREEAGLIPFA